MPPTPQKRPKEQAQEKGIYCNTCDKVPCKHIEGVEIKAEKELARILEGAYYKGFTKHYTFWTYAARAILKKYKLVKRKKK